MEMSVTKRVGGVTIELDNESASALAECLDHFTCGWTDLIASIEQRLESKEFERPVLHGIDE